MDLKPSRSTLRIRQVAHARMPKAETVGCKDVSIFSLGQKRYFSSVRNIVVVFNGFSLSKMIEMQKITMEESEEKERKKQREM